MVKLGIIELDPQNKSLKKLIPPVNRTIWNDIISSGYTIKKRNCIEIRENQRYLATFYKSPNTNKWKFFILAPLPKYSRDVAIINEEIYIIKPDGTGEKVRFKGVKNLYDAIVYNYHQSLLAELEDIEEMNNEELDEERD